MKPILILYATREGHTRRIAEHIAATVRARGLTAEVQDVAELSEPFDLDGYAAAVLAASVHIGRHEREMVAFAKRHRAELDCMPSAFLSVSLSEAGAENQGASPEKRAASSADVRQLIDAFFEETGWHPRRVKPVAGALLYTQYGLLLRFVMKLIAKRAGGSTDTSRDHKYTDWVALDRFVDELAGEVSAAAAA